MIDEGTLINLLYTHSLTVYFGIVLFFVEFQAVALSFWLLDLEALLSAQNAFVCRCQELDLDLIRKVQA